VNEHPKDLIPVTSIRASNRPDLDNIGKIPNFNAPSKHAAGRVGKQRPKRRNRGKP
jgi:hypothetical protein